MIEPVVVDPDKVRSPFDRESFDDPSTDPQNITSAQCPKPARGPRLSRARSRFVIIRRPVANEEFRSSAMAPIVSRFSRHGRQGTPNRAEWRSCSFGPRPLAVRQNAPIVAESQGQLLHAPSPKERAPFAKPAFTAKV